VLRVVPLENEAVNECWLSDRDRFSYEGLYAPDRITRPMLRRGGQWQEVDWPEALDFAAESLAEVKRRHGAAAVGALASPASTVEELFLLGRLVRGLGSENVDFRLRQSDFSADGGRAGVPWLGMAVADVDRLDRLLLVGSFLRKDHPLLAIRVRQAARRGAQVSVLHATDDDLLLPLAAKAVVRPSDWVREMAGIAAAVAAIKGGAAPVAGVEPSEAARRIAASLCSGASGAILLGNAAVQHPRAAQLQAWAAWIAQATGARFGLTGEAANSVGGYLAGAVPGALGLNAAAMVREPRRAYLLFNCEPEYDTADPAATLAALGQADTVISFAAYRGSALDYADAILPVAPWTETSGTFVSCEGRVQSFNGVVPPLGEARPGWKVLRVLANRLQLAGFDYDSSEAVRAEALPADVAARLSNDVPIAPALAPASGQGAERIADVPVYFADPVVRRAQSLQRTADARPPRASANARTLAGFGLQPGDKARVRQGEASALLECALDEGLPDGVVRVPAAHASTSTLGPMFGPLTMERA
jgi:NADH-quinone oxidoreductase subunit G